MKLKIHATAIALMICCLTAVGQGRLVFGQAEWDFGDIKETDGKVRHTFVCENKGDEPVLIINITVSCGCTVPEYVRKPILPGETAKIDVSFDPMNRPGTFAKELGVFSSDRKKIATLVVRGNVIPHPKTVDETYPITTGTGLRLESNFNAFSYVYHGTVVQAFIGIVNTSKEALTLEIRPEAQNNLLSVSFPKKLSAGAKAEIGLVYDIPANSSVYGSMTDIMSIYVNGRKVPTQLTAYGIAVDNPNTIKGDKKPKSAIDKTIVRFGEHKSTDTVTPQTVTLSNAGNAPMTVRAVEIDNGIACSLKTGHKIPAGGKTDIRISITPSKLGSGPVSANITLITDDPDRPMRKIRVTAIIEN